MQVNLWGLDAIKTKGESVAIVLHFVGARPVREGTGRIARFELIPLEVHTSLLNTKSGVSQQDVVTCGSPLACKVCQGRDRRHCRCFKLTIVKVSTLM